MLFQKMRVTQFSWDNIFQTMTPGTPDDKQYFYLKNRFHTYCHQKLLLINHVTHSYFLHYLIGSSSYNIEAQSVIFSV